MKDINEKILVAKARLQALEAKAKNEKRKNETRLRVLLGAYMLEHLKTHPQEGAKVVAFFGADSRDGKFVTEMLAEE